jgi:hypothetical protein
MNSIVVWTGWTAGSLALVAVLAFRLSAPDRRDIFLPGETTAGHYQIELSCEACHTRYGGVGQDACLNCHSQELDVAEDSHPRSKFTDPRNADRIRTLDATLCITCHVEHRPPITGDMAVTLPADFCAHCHSDVAEERTSHAGLGFQTCASAGCHNFHDNRALYEDFLARNSDSPDLLVSASVAVRRPLPPPGPSLVVTDTDGGPHGPTDAALIDAWAGSAHATGGVNCSGCHTAGGVAWTDAPSLDTCESCHASQAEGFLAGRHGMRLAAGLEPMSPSLARLPMRPEAFGRNLDCSSCHGPHDVDTVRAAVDACLECHQDTHSLAYDDSPHSALWRAEWSGNGAAGTGVSCATCHLPREVQREGADDVVRVQHNQNDNLRPNEKMIRDVCMNCHGLEFSIDALADRALIEANFAGRPTVHIESIDMVRRRNNQTNSSGESR